MAFAEGQADQKNGPFHSQIGPYVGHRLAFIQVYMSSAVIRGDCFQWVSRGVPSTPAVAGTPCGRKNTRNFILPASWCYCAAVVSTETGTLEDMGPTLEALSTEFSAHAEIIATPASTSCSVAHQLQEKLSNARSPAEQRTNERNFLGSQRATCPKSG